MVSERRMLPVYHWRRPAGATNFGDELTYYILRQFCGINAYWAPPEEAQLIGCGSIIEHMPAYWQGTVLGSGKLHQSITRLRAARVLAVRGPLTARNLYLNGKLLPRGGDPVLGDLGLLAEQLVRAPAKKHLIGIVPHWSDTVLAERREWDGFNPVVINVSQNPLEVIEQIGECRKIITSSLHGCITADAFGIPCRTELSGENKFGGGIFKWADYHASLGIPFTPGVTRLAPKQVVEDIQDDLYELLQTLLRTTSPAQGTHLLACSASVSSRQSW